MDNYRFLLVEDEDKAREAAQSLFQDLFPDSNLDIAGTVEEGCEKIEETAREGRFYDLAILDFRLPLTASSPTEIDESLCRLVRGKNGGTVVMHITGFAGDAQVIAHQLRDHPKRGPRGSIIDKAQADWARQLIARCREHLYGSEIERAMDSIFATADGAGAAGTDGKRLGDTGVPSGPSISIEELRRRISAYWRFLDDEAKDRVQLQFVVDAEANPVRVTMR